MMTDSPFLRQLISGVLALIVIGSLCFIAVYQATSKQVFNLPVELVGVGGVIMGYYFSHASASNAAIQITNGLIASRPAVVSGQVTETTTTNPTTSPVVPPLVPPPVVPPVK
jgi:hypothetical protein